MLSTVLNIVMFEDCKNQVGCKLNRRQIAIVSKLQNKNNMREVFRIMIAVQFAALETQLNAIPEFKDHHHISNQIHMWSP